MDFLESFTNFDEDEEPNKEDFKIAHGALSNYVRHNRLGKLCMCKGCVDVRMTYVRVMQICRIQEDSEKEGEEWKGDQTNPQ